MAHPATPPFVLTAEQRLDAIRAHYSRLTEADQLTLLSDMIQGHPALNRRDSFIDELQPVDAAFDAAYETLSGLQREPATAGYGWWPKGRAA